MDWLNSGIITSLITVIIVSILYMVGEGFTKKHTVSNIAIGFVLYIGLLELLGFGFVALQGKTWMFALVSVLLICALGFLGVRNNLSNGMTFEVIKPYILSIIITLFLVMITFVFYRSDADDSFYVSNVALFQSSSVLNPYDSSFGITTLGTVPMYDFQIWESIMALVSSLFRVEAVATMHTYIIPTLLIVSASAYLFLGETLCEDKRQANLFYVGISLFHLFGGYAVYSQGSFLLSRIWQGKAVYLMVVLPVMIAILLKETKQKSKNLWLQLAICVLAGMALNPTSLYVLGFQLLFMIIVMAITNREVKLLLQSIPSVIFVVLFTLLIYLRTSRFDGQIEASSQVQGTFVKDVFNLFWGSGKIYFWLFIVCALIIFIIGTKTARAFFVYTPLLMFLTIWNPTVGKIVAETVTKAPSYWRVFWLIPVGPAICYATVLLWNKTRGRINKGIILVIGVLALCVPGTWMFTEENHFVMANNVEKIPNEVKEFGEQIVALGDRPIVLGCGDFSTTLRQKYTDIELIASREQYIYDLFLYRGEKNKQKNVNICRILQMGY